jgi:hypothetical protein
MRRTVPGTQEVIGREFIYVQSDASETFHQLANSISSLRPSIAIPRSGGAGEEKVSIKLKDGTYLMGISYKGDIEGWRTRFVRFCETSGRKYGFIKGGRLSLSDGFCCSIEDLEIRFE